MKLLKEVSEQLTKILGHMGYNLDVDQTYLSSVVINDEGKQVVDYSESLSWAIMEKVQADEFPKFNSEYAGVFFKRWSFEKNDRVVGLDVIDLNNAGRVVVESYRTK
ncbi:hypothetical protein EJA72_28955 [Pseudomonas sp. PB120]|uniref:hypothetical protein n=1 Tax=Pseudomonas sp. PB120 TaxID=2494700 RepID=UPI0012FD4C68|nr:hypothetical protein [Pseudomonas sp. PB120]MVV52232.1 hypothetical protein [Pseudomonas sp. PB120]